jgi:hypothetical protein
MNDFEQRNKKELQLLTETATVTQKSSTKDKINYSVISSKVAKMSIQNVS